MAFLEEKCHESQCLICTQVCLFEGWWSFHLDEREESCLGTERLTERRTKFISTFFFKAEVSKCFTSRKDDVIGKCWPSHRKRCGGFGEKQSCSSEQSLRLFKVICLCKFDNCEKQKWEMWVLVFSCFCYGDDFVDERLIFVAQSDVIVTHNTALF